MGGVAEKMYDMLFSPMKIGTMTVKNRIVMAAAEFSLGQPNGKPTERMMDYYEERAKGGIGLIIPGICRVNDMGGASTFTHVATTATCYNILFVIQTVMILSIIQLMSYSLSFFIFPTIIFFIFRIVRFSIHVSKNHTNICESK